MNVMVAIPDKYFLNTTVEEMAEKMKLSTALLMFQSGKISAGAACEFVGIDRYSFLVACKKHKIEVLSVSGEDLDSDLQAIEQITRTC